MNSRIKSSISIREMGKSDSEKEAFLGLINACDVGTHRFRVSRGDDPGRLSQYFGETITLGAWQEKQLVGTVAVSIQRRWVADKLRDIHYLHDLRVHPDMRRCGVATMLGRQLKHVICADAWLMGTVLKDNPLLATILLETGRYFGEPQLLTTTGHVVIARPKTVGPYEELTREAWLERSKTIRNNYDFSADLYTYIARESSIRYLGFALGRSNETLACLVDESERRSFFMGDHQVSLSYLAYLSSADLTTTAVDTLASCAASDYIAFSGNYKGFCYPSAPLFSSQTWLFTHESRAYNVREQELLLI